MIYVISLAYMPARIVGRSLASFYSTKNPDLQLQHILVDQHYPLDRRENETKIRWLCDYHEITYLDPGKNLGLHNGFNYAMEHIGVSQNDLVIGYDPDSVPITPGWDMALVRTIEGDPDRKIVWSSLLTPRALADLKRVGYRKKRIDGYIEAWLPLAPVTNSVCCFRGDWLLSVGGFWEPREYYGHLEAALWQRLGGYQWAFCPGWQETDDMRADHDLDYNRWKHIHSHRDLFQGDFAAWLKAGKPYYDQVSSDPP